MKLSYNWLKEYVDIDCSPENLAEILTNTGLEVEDTEVWESVPGGLNGVVLGEVLSCSKHPEAERLTVTSVGIGKENPLQIICGAPNVAAGQKVAVATIGTAVFKGEEQLKIERSKIRGILSEGMICAEDELGLGSSHEGIMVLDNNAVPGTPAADYFRIERDHIYTIGLTPNRIDSGSHYGAARDLAAWFSLKNKTALRLPHTEELQADNNSLEIPVRIENKNDCKRYCGITISGITVGESPEWLRNRLRATGHQPINNIADITNYVLLELGQPLHAFDADKIDGKEIVVKNLPDKTRFVTLDELERELSGDDLIICSKSKPMCIAGVFGGIGSGVTENTRNIFLESAWFNPVSVRRTAKRHALQTDASFRFERGADIEMAPFALRRAAMLIKEVAGGVISSDMIDVYPEPYKPAETDISFAGIARLTGTEIDKNIIKSILDSLGFKIATETAEGMRLIVPSYKVDVTREADVIEEILRIWGYNNIKTTEKIVSTLTYQKKPDREKAINRIAELLTGNGFAEMMANSLVPGSWFADNNDSHQGKTVTLANPLSSDLNTMRRSLVPGVLNAVAWNINRQNPNLKLFEFGTCYFGSEKEAMRPEVKDFTENVNLTITITGDVTPPSWNSKGTGSDIYHIKAYIELVLSRLGVMHLLDERQSGKNGYYSESAEYILRGKPVAAAGKISSAYLNMFGIKQEVFSGSIEWDKIIDIAAGEIIQHKALPKYPAVRRDLALLVDKKVKYSDIKTLAFKTEKNILREVNLFDLYEHPSLGENKKSYAVSFILRDDRKTLTEKSIEKVMNNFVKQFEKELGAAIRK